jgi:hypothetical protein
MSQPKDVGRQVPSSVFFVPKPALVKAGVAKDQDPRALATEGKTIAPLLTLRQLSAIPPEIPELPE